MKSFIRNISKVLILATLFFSCSSDLDFNQVNDFKLEPVFVANLAFFNVPAKRFYNNGAEQEIAFDTQDFDAFRKKFFKDHLVKTELDFELENTINRAFSLSVSFLDKNNKVLQTLTYSIPAYSGSANVIKYPTEVFVNQRLDLLKQTTKLKFVVTMAPGPPINESSSGNLKLRSSATVYMEIE